MFNGRRSYALIPSSRDVRGSVSNGNLLSTGSHDMNVSYAVHWPFPEFREGTNYENEAAEITEDVRKQRRSYSSSSSEASAEAGAYEDGGSDYDISRSETGSTMTSRRADSVVGSDMSALYAFRRAQQQANSKKSHNKCAKVAVHPLSSDWNLKPSATKSYREHLQQEIQKTASEEEKQLNENIQTSHLQASSKVRSVLTDHISNLFSRSSTPASESSPAQYGHTSTRSFERPSSANNVSGGGEPLKKSFVAGVVRPQSAALFRRDEQRGRSSDQQETKSSTALLSSTTREEALMGNSTNSAVSSFSRGTAPLSIDDLTLLIRLFEPDAKLKQHTTMGLGAGRECSPLPLSGQQKTAKASSRNGIPLKHMSLEWLGKRHGFSKQVIPPLVNLHLGNFVSQVAKCDGDIPPDRVLINSPRSAIILLRNGVGVEELIPRPAVVKKARVLAARQALEAQTQRPTSGGSSTANTPTSMKEVDSKVRLGQGHPFKSRPSTATTSTGRSMRSMIGQGVTVVEVQSPNPRASSVIPGLSSRSSSVADGALNRVVGASATDLTLSKAEEEIERLRLQRLERLVSEYVALCRLVSLNEIITFCSKYDKNRPSSALRVECSLTEEKRTHFIQSENSSPLSSSSSGLLSRETTTATRSISSVAGAKIGDLLPEEAAEEKFQRIFDRNAAFERTVVNCQQKVIADDETKRLAAKMRLEREEERSAKLVAMREAKLAQMRADREAREAVKKIQQASVDRSRAYRASSLREPIIRRDDEVENIAAARQKAIARYKKVIVQDIHKDDVKRQNVSAARAAKQPKVTWDEALSR